MKRTLCVTLAALLLMTPCQRAPAPVPVVLGLALKCVAIGALGATGIILWNCEQPYYLCCYRMDGEETYWAVSQASVRTLAKTGGVRCEGPSKDRKEMDQRAWVNNHDPEHPMFPCGPLGAPLPGATWTNYTIVSLDQSMNGGKIWKNAGSLVVEPNESNWNVALLGPTGTAGMTSAELYRLAECDLVVTNGLPWPKEIKDYRVRGLVSEVPSPLLRIRKSSASN